MTGFRGEPLQKPAEKADYADEQIIDAIQQNPERQGAEESRDPVIENHALERGAERSRPVLLDMYC
jgi:hypothetical protein